MITKICTKCHEEKPLTEFNKNKRAKDGRHSACKSCRKAYREQNKEKEAARKKRWIKNNKKHCAAFAKDYYKRNKKKIDAQRKARDEVNKEKITKQQKAYREKNKEKYVAYDKANYKKNKKKRNAQRKANYENNKDRYLKQQKVYRENNKEKCAASIKVWREKNRDKVLSFHAKRRAVKRQAIPFWFEKEKCEFLYKKCQELNELWGTNMEVDHFIPLQGKNVCGLHCWDNLQLLDAPLNRSKLNKNPYDIDYKKEFDKFVPFVLPFLLSAGPDNVLGPPMVQHHIGFQQGTVM